MTVKEYDKIINERLKSARYKHSKNVAKEAVRLAKKYGADVHKAEIAGLLHDITKEADTEEHMDVIRRAGIELTELEQSSHYGTLFRAVRMCRRNWTSMTKKLLMLSVTIPLEEPI